MQQDIVLKKMNMISENSFSCFPYISLYKICDPWWCHFWPKGHNLDKLGKGSLGDATYYISRPYGFRQDFF